jgi:hypothetical protein
MMLGLARSALLSSALLLGIAPLLAGCGASIDEAYMAKDSSGDIKATTFHVLGDQIHCIIKFIGGDEDSRVAFSLKGPGDIKLTDDEIYPRPSSDKQGPIKLDMQLFTLDADGGRDEDGPWTEGDYEMEISLDGELDQTLEFKITP